MSNTMEILNVLWLSQKELDVKQISKMTGFKEKQIYKCIQNLKIKGWVKSFGKKEMKIRGLTHSTYKISDAPSVRRHVENRLQRYQRSGE